MTAIAPVPAGADWTIYANSVQLAHSIVELLAYFEIADLGGATVALLRAATTEMAEQANLGWQFADDEAPVGLVRTVTRLAAVDPGLGGPCSVALLDHLLGNRLDPTG